MTTLADFLLARIAEDEELARATDGLSWRAVCCVEYANHAVAWLPARVLAECEAKRRIVRACVREWGEGGAAEMLAAVTLSSLALPYADHPDYVDHPPYADHPDAEEWCP